MSRLDCPMEKKRRDTSFAKAAHNNSELYLIVICILSDCDQVLTAIYGALHAIAERRPRQHAPFTAYREEA